MSSITYHTEGIILRHLDVREHDRIFYAYTKDFGLMTLFGKSVRLAKSKLSSHLMLFSHSRLSFVAGRDLLRITDAETLNYFSVDSDRFAAAGRISSFVLRMVRGQTQEPALWRLVASAFSLLRSDSEISCAPSFKSPVRRQSISQLDIFELLFTSRLLYILGYFDKSQHAEDYFLSVDEWHKPMTILSDNDMARRELARGASQGIRISRL